MFQYIVSRALWLVPTLLAMALVTFLVMHATPGSPLDPIAEGANPLSPEAQKALAAYYGLDKPLWQQFAIFIGKAVHGDFGYSFVYKTRTVAEILRETFPVSLFLGSMALVLAVVGGLTLGILAAVHQNRGWDYVSVSLATVGVAVPNFVLAVFLIILFSFILPLFRTGGWELTRERVQEQEACTCPQPEADSSEDEPCRCSEPSPDRSEYRCHQGHRAPPEDGQRERDPLPDQGQRQAGGQDVRRRDQREDRAGGDTEEGPSDPDGPRCEEGVHTSTVERPGAGSHTTSIGRIAPVLQGVHERVEGTGSPRLKSGGPGTDGFP